MRVHNEKRLAAYLDQKLPMSSARHDDIVRYTVETPTRFARFVGYSSTGRRVELDARSTFIGWRQDDCANAVVCFRRGRHHIELRLRAGAVESIRCSIGAGLVYSGAQGSARRDRSRSYIGRAGELLVRRRLRLLVYRVLSISPTARSAPQLHAARPNTL